MAASTSTKSLAGAAVGPRHGLGSYALRWTLHDKDPLSSCRILLSVTAELGLALVQIADNVDLLELDARQRRELKARPTTPRYRWRWGHAHTEPQISVACSELRRPSTQGISGS